jgi:hypothetical protein
MSQDLASSLGAIPIELRERQQWVTWRREDRDGKPTKIPLRPDGSGNASTTDRATWGTFSQVFETARRGGVDGIGYVFTNDDPYVGVDLDACVDEHGELHRDAGLIVSSLDSYTERSVSGTGIHIIARAGLNGSRNRTTNTEWGGDFECYGHSRYFCFTGDHLRGTPVTIEQRQHELNQVIGRIFPTPATTTSAPPVWTRPPSLDLGDEELLDRARRARNGNNFDRLWRGDTTGHSSHSEADLALLGLLAFWTGPDRARLDQLFRRSGLFRPKWDTKRGDTTYGQQTIERALEGRTEFYAGRRTPAEPGPAPTLAAGEDASDTEQLLRLVTLPEFAGQNEPSAEPLVGTDDDAILSADGTALLYGDGGASKTTLTIDAVAHWAAGKPWLGLPTARPLRVLLIENEGPRGPFRQKLSRKLNTWQGPDFANNVYVLEEPWARFTFACDTHRQQLANHVTDHTIDIVVANPLQELGTEGGGTPDDVSAFNAHVNDFRNRVGRPVAIWFIHHENKAGDISGAWERVPDTLIHARLEGQGRTALHWSKTRWSSSLHNTTMKLRWLTDSASFELEDADAVKAAKAAADAQAEDWVVQFVDSNPGLARSKVEDAFSASGGVRNAARRAIDNQLQLLAAWHENPTLCGEQQPLLATTTGESRNGTYLIPFNHANSPLATPLDGEGGEQGVSPPGDGPLAARRPL